FKTKEGWLIIYHGVTRNEQGNIYNACAALFSLTHPFQELARLPYPLFSPEKSWEKTGYVNNVVFPTGTAIFDDRLYIYYGAADDSIAVASVNLEELIQELLKHKISS
ncbi:MAG: pesticidal protein Cry7Aa, partial [Pedobacter sp.]